MNRFSLPLAGIGLVIVSSFVAPASAAQLPGCTLVGDSDVSSAVGSPVHALPYLVFDFGPISSCLFAGDAVGAGVLVIRYAGFFASEEVQPFSLDQERLPLLLTAGAAPAASVIALAPVDGVGDAAAWVVPVDPSTAPDSLGRLLVRRGPDAFVIGTQLGPNAIDSAISVARIVLVTAT
jgi:hypothetical protein